MTNTEAIAIINNEIACLQRPCTNSKCVSCDLALPSAEPIIEAFKLAIKTIKNEENRQRGKWITYLDVEHIMPERYY